MTILIARTTKQLPLRQLHHHHHHLYHSHNDSFLHTQTNLVQRHRLKFSLSSAANFSAISLQQCFASTATNSKCNGTNNTNRSESLFMARQLQTITIPTTSSVCNTTDIASSSFIPSACCFLGCSFVLLSSNDIHCHLQPKYNHTISSFSKQQQQQKQQQQHKLGNSQKRNIPCQYGSSIKTFTTNPPLDKIIIKGQSQKEDEKTTTKTNRKDCPLCKKYSQGPCGKLFQTWLDCTDAHPGKNVETKEPLHLSKCAHLAKPLADCLADHEEYYNALDDEKDEDKKEEEEDEEREELKHAWSEFIHNLEKESSRKKQTSFPTEIQPDMQIRQNSKKIMGMAMFHSHENTSSSSPPKGKNKNKNNNKKKELLLAYIKDQNGTILGAGGRNDLYLLNEENGGGDLILRFGITDTSISISACALYESSERGGDEEEDMDQPIYVYTQLLPPKR